MSNMNINRLIDHTLLRPDASISDIENLCAEALKWNFYSVCIQPYWVSDAYRTLAGQDVKVCTVVGFPHGSNTKETKVKEAREAIDAGTDEFDLVINIGALFSDRKTVVAHELEALAEVAREGQVVSKAILETGYLSTPQIEELTNMCVDTGINFVKTSTGFGPRGASLADVETMAKAIAVKDSKNTGIKAAGGISTRDEALAMIAAGATRLGTSRGIALCCSEF